MSKTYRTNSDSNDNKQHRHVARQNYHSKHIQDRRKRKSHDFASNTFDAKEFLNEIKPIRNCKGVLTNAERDTLIYWLDHLQACFVNEKFTGKILYQFVRRLNGMMKDNKDIQALVICYCEENPLFCEQFLEFAQSALNDLSSEAYSYILSFVAYSHIHPDQLWLTSWLERTQYPLTYFTENKLHELEAVSILIRSQHYEIEPWINQWFERTLNIIETMSLDYKARVLPLVGTLKVEPPQEWMNVYLKNSADLFKELTGRNLFTFGTAFYLKNVRNNKEAVEQWLQRTHKEMKTTDVYSVMTCLLPLVHLNIDIPEEWQVAWMNKILVDFDKILCDPQHRVTGIAHVLYTLTLMQKDIGFCRLFLEKCNTVFEMHEKNVCKNYEYIQFRKIVFSKNYFALMGFDLCIDINDYKTLTTRTVETTRTSSKTQMRFSKSLNLLFGKSIHEEVFIPIIFDNVDFFVEDMMLVIEIDGHHHYNDGKQNALTQTKTFMLEKAGYTVRRFTIEIMNYMDHELVDFLRKELSEYSLQPHRDVLKG